MPICRFGGRDFSAPGKELNHHNHQWITHSPPTTLPPPMTMKIQSGLQLMLCVLHCWHQVILQCWEEIQCPLCHCFKLLPWLQTHVCHSQMPAAAQQPTEGSCHRVVHMARQHGGPTDTCKTAGLDSQFDAAGSERTWICRFLKNNANQITVKRAYGLDPKCVQAFNKMAMVGPLSSSHHSGDTPREHLQ